MCREMNSKQSNAFLYTTLHFAQVLTFKGQTSLLPSKATLCHPSTVQHHILSISFTSAGFPGRECKK